MVTKRGKGEGVCAQEQSRVRITFLRRFEGREGDESPVTGSLRVCGSAVLKLAVCFVGEGDIVGVRKR